ncbi:MAG: HAD hydrolase-like protein [Actinomycetaceae bacterium]|nr:HAD hydrolase-like protein [Actinomycetaceae bacterium]
MKRNIVLFDLDGTITDSGPLIMNVVQETLNELGVKPQTDEQLKAWVGPPLFDSFRDYAKIPENEIDNAIAAYRRRYRERMYDAPLFPGIFESIKTLHEHGFPLAVATSKLQKLARPIVEKTGLGPYFAYVAGSTADGPAQTKADVINSALAALKEQGYDTEHAVMVGDRFYDIEGAAKTGLEAYGVAWAGTDPAEFEGAIGIATTPEELTQLILTRANSL